MIFNKKKIFYCSLVEIVGIHPEDIKIIVDFIIYFFQICTKIKRMISFDMEYIMILFLQF